MSGVLVFFFRAKILVLCLDGGIDSLHMEDATVLAVRTRGCGMPVRQSERAACRGGRDGTIIETTTISKVQVVLRMYAFEYVTRSL